LKQLLDVHAPPLQSSKPKRRQAVAWYNDECHRVKKLTRRLEKIYRASKSVDDLAQWKNHLKGQRRLLQRSRTTYWSTVIRESPDNRSLWRHLNNLLKPADTEHADPTRNKYNG
jgi:hypothetical protein